MIMELDDIHQSGATIVFNEEKKKQILNSCVSFQEIVTWLFK